MNRREFVKTLGASSALMALKPTYLAAAEIWQFNCFTKHLQWLDFKETAAYTIPEEFQKYSYDKLVNKVYNLLRPHSYKGILITENPLPFSKSR